MRAAPIWEKYKESHSGMKLDIGFSLLLQGLPAIAELLTAIQNERIIHLEQRTKARKESTQPAQQAEAKRAIAKRETLLQLAAYQRETSLQVLEHQHVLEQWSLGLLPAQLLDTSSCSGSIPLQIFLVLPTIQAVPTDQCAGFNHLESKLAQGLADFLNQHYPLNSSERPTELLSGAWRDHSLQREARIKSLFDQLRDRPTLVLETDIVGESLNIRFAYWGFNQPQYCYRTISSDFPWRNIVYGSMKQRALRWQETAQQLLALGESQESIHQMGGNNIRNLEVLEKEAQWQQHGIDTSTLYLPYTLAPEDFDELYWMLTRSYRVLAGWVADAHHLLNAE